MISAFLSGRYDRREELAEYAALLRRLGVVVNARWLTGIHSVPEGLTGAEANHLRARFALEDLEDVLASEAFILFNGSGGLTKPERGGRHFEHGYARTLNKEVYILEEQRNVFDYLPGVTFLPDFAALTTRLILSSHLPMETH